MIGYIKGRVILRGEDFLIVESGDVGYKVFVSEKTLGKTNTGKSQIKLFIWPHLKRTTIELYGCPTQKEFNVFQELESMTGIGPKTALSLASFGSLEKLKKAIETKDDRIREIKGIGQKRLQRLMLELTGKIAGLKEKKRVSFEDDEAFQGLLGLGFSKKMARTALLKVSKRVKDPKERIEDALKILGKK